MLNGVIFMSQAPPLNGSRFKSESAALPEKIGPVVGQTVKQAKKKAGVAFDDDIPTVGPEIFILRMKGQRSLNFTIWAARPRGIWVHWAGKGSEPHFRDEEQCPGCAKRQEKRWKGFLHCYCAEMRQEVFLELTPASARSLADQLAGQTSMRGGRIQVKRTSSDNGRLYISTLTPIGDLNLLPKEKDPRPSILRLWGVSEEQAEAWLKAEVGTENGGHFS
jgi:hypothetical protein